jgi:hypothetical protein
MLQLARPAMGLAVLLAMLVGAAGTTHLVTFSPGLHLLADELQSLIGEAPGERIVATANFVGAMCTVLPRVMPRLGSLAHAHTTALCQPLTGRQPGDGPGPRSGDHGSDSDMH